MCLACVWTEINCVKDVFCQVKKSVHSYEQNCMSTAKRKVIFNRLEERGREVGHLHNSTADATNMVKQRRLGVSACVRENVHECSVTSKKS